MCRPNFSLLPIHDAFQRLTRWLEPQMPAKLLHDHKKISDAQPVAVALLQRVHKVVYFRHWWRFLKLNHFAWFPSEVQARLRLARLTPVIERLRTAPGEHLQTRPTLQVSRGNTWVRNLWAGVRLQEHGVKSAAALTMDDLIVLWQSRPVTLQV